MITNKSKIKYEVIVDSKEFNDIREMYIKNKYITKINDNERKSIKGGIFNHASFFVEDVRYHIFLTTKQYELFKRLRNETKNKK